jgi:hypothetical protein
VEAWLSDAFADENAVSRAWSMLIFRKITPNIRNMPITIPRFDMNILNLMLFMLNIRTTPHPAKCNFQRKL